MATRNEKPKYYFGIDLGTTNSVLAWAKMPPDNATFLEPEVVKIQMPTSTNYRASVPNELLPSCVYFGAGPPNPIVGLYAKGMLVASPHNVVKSIKTKIGQGQAARMFDREPNEISALILGALINGLPAWFPKDAFLKEVMIGIPASFERKMCEATLLAAKQAGFKNPILIEEPIAALYDYSNLQNRDKFPLGAVGIEFSQDKPKLILVFDLGGGTLDVSLHEVSLCGGGKLNVKEIAVSRYTSIAGDKFDELLAERFLDIYQRRHGQLHNRALLKPQFEEYAEQAKIQLSWAVDHGDTEITFNSLNRFGNLDGVFDYKLTLCEYEKVVDRLLGHSSNLDLAATFSPSNPPTNIIDPILDVLKKSEKEFGNIKTPDAVLLNGAMTRLSTIENRLQNFFPAVPISSLGDPDKAVARGAVIEHYKKYNP